MLPRFQKSSIFLVCGFHFVEDTEKQIQVPAKAHIVKIDDATFLFTSTLAIIYAKTDTT